MYRLNNGVVYRADTLYGQYVQTGEKNEFT